MSEIVYTHTEKKRDVVDHIGTIDYANRAPLDDKVTIFKGKNKVAVVDSRLVCGVPNHDPKNKDKRWYKWRSVSSLGLRRNSNGTIIPWNCSRPWDFKLATPWKHSNIGEAFETLEYDTEVGEAYRRACWETFGIIKFEDVFPIADQYGIVKYDYIPHPFRGSMRLPKMEEFVAATFGKTRTTGRMVNAVAGTDPWIVAYAYAFRGYVDDSKLITFLEDNHFDDEMMEYQPYSPNIRHLVKAMTPEQANALVTRKLDITDMGLLNMLMRQGKTYGIRMVQLKAETWQGIVNPPRV
jgi:hypothetical protein